MAERFVRDIARPASTARVAVQWLYFAYLAATRDQNGAAMSLGRTSTFLDVYLQRDLAAGRLTVLVSHWQGKELNSPNDIVIRSDGAKQHLLLKLLLHLYLVLLQA